MYKFTTYIITISVQCHVKVHYLHYNCLIRRVGKAACARPSSVLRRASARCPFQGTVTSSLLEGTEAPGISHIRDTSLFGKGKQNVESVKKASTICFRITYTASYNEKRNKINLKWCWISEAHSKILLQKSFFLKSTF